MHHAANRLLQVASGRPISVAMGSILRLVVQAIIPLVSSWTYQRRSGSQQVRGSGTFGEVMVHDWQTAKLLKPSAIKPMLATLEQALFIKTLGRLSQRDCQARKEAIGKIIG